MNESNIVIEVGQTWADHAGRTATVVYVGRFSAVLEYTDGQGEELCYHNELRNYWTHVDTPNGLPEGWVTVGVHVGYQFAKGDDHLYIEPDDEKVLIVTGQDGVLVNPDDIRTILDLLSEDER